jgi:hypothetical protein
VPSLREQTDERADQEEDSAGGDGCHRSPEPDRGHQNEVRRPGRDERRVIQAIAGTREAIPAGVTKLVDRLTHSSDLGPREFSREFLLFVISQRAGLDDAGQLVVHCPDLRPQVAESGTGDPEPVVQLHRGKFMRCREPEKRLFGAV